MDGRLIIFIGSLVIYMPLAGVLLYVWWKHGKDDSKVALARFVFLAGSFGLFIFMMTV